MLLGKKLKEIPMQLYTEFNRAYGTIKALEVEGDLAGAEKATKYREELFDKMDRYSCHSLTKDMVEENSPQAHILSIVELSEDENYADSLIFINKVGKSFLLNVLSEETDIVKHIIKKAKKAHYEDKQKSLEDYLEKISKATKWISVVCPGRSADEIGFLSKFHDFVIINVYGVDSNASLEGLSDKEIIERKHKQLSVDTEKHENLKKKLREKKLRFAERKEQLRDSYYRNNQPIPDTLHQYEEQSLLVPFKNDDREGFISSVLDVMDSFNLNCVIYIESGKTFYLYKDKSKVEIGPFEILNFEVISICCDLLRAKKLHTESVFYKPKELSEKWTSAHSFAQAVMLSCKGYIY
ncbi:MAG: hypothetical protein IJS60_02760 [Abditibacteriota bacterium]|nr:hypothetical protein [Abditibacteriota bacterium]